MRATLDTLKALAEQHGFYVQELFYGKTTRQAIAVRPRLDAKLDWRGTTTRTIAEAIKALREKSK